MPHPVKLGSDSFLLGQGCLWGMYIGDALSMPVHWSYDIEQMRRNYGQIKEYM